MNEYDKELELINSNIKFIEEKKSMALDLVFNGDISKDVLKVQFEQYEQEIKNLNVKKTDILNQIEQLNNNYDNLDKMSKLIEEEINGGSLNEFIRKFVDEIIISKIDGDRYNIKLDIYLDLLGEEKSKTKGARHITGPSEEDVLYLENQECNTIEDLRADCKRNKFTYNVYVETL